MSQRSSGYARSPREKYETPAWVVMDGLVGVLSVKGKVVGEHACGTGKMVAALYDAGASKVLASDIVWRGSKLMQRYRADFKRVDFTKRGAYERKVQLLISNPPYGEQSELAEAFIERGLDLLRAPDGPKAMALLLSAEFDLAGSRSHLLERCPEYVGVIRLRRRIEWFKRKMKLVTDEETGQRKKKRGSGPSKNHAWFIWHRDGRPGIAGPTTWYAPADGVLL